MSAYFESMHPLKTCIDMHYLSKYNVQKEGFHYVLSTLRRPDSWRWSLLRKMRKKRQSDDRFFFQGRIRFEYVERPERWIQLQIRQYLSPLKIDCRFALLVFRRIWSSSLLYGQDDQCRLHASFLLDFYPLHHRHRRFHHDPMRNIHG